MVAKAALAAFTRGLAIDLAEDGITVNAVAPGPVATTNYRQAKGGAAIRSRALPIPVGRLADPEDIGMTIAFLASAGARHVTGQVIAIDGGEQAAGPYAIMWADRRQRRQSGLPT